MKLPKLKFNDGAEAKEFRRKMRMNQSEFWARVGTTQSGGSRYESGRGIPEPVQILLNVAYAPEGQAQRVTDALRGWKGGA